MLYCDKSLFPIGNFAGEDVVGVSDHLVFL